MNNGKTRPAGDTVLRLAHRLEQVCESEWRAKEKNITLRQLDILTATMENDSESQTTLVAATNVDRSTLADITRRLQRKGMLQRRRTKEDARAYAVRLTDLGRKTVIQASAKVEKVTDEMLGSLTQAERALLAKLLKKVVTAAEARARA